MTGTDSKYHFPSDIELSNPPLVEAWLEIRWQLETVGPGLSRDSKFPFALGAFYERVKERFPVREALDISRAPEEMFPHKVRYRFRPSEGEWPILQLGPGVATVNFVTNYTWEHFQSTALYLRNNLLEAYEDEELEVDVVVLRYRNGEPFDYAARNVLEFLQRNLNTKIQLPDHIPGQVASTRWPTTANVRLAFDLVDPAGTGVVQFVSGTRTREDPTTQRTAEEDVLLWQLEVASGGDDAPPLSDEDKFSEWLVSAHAVIHDWFFSLVEGAKLESYKGEGE